MNKNLELDIEKALIFFKEAKYKKSLKELIKIKKTNNHFIIHWYLSHIYFRLKNFKSALLHIKKSIKLKSKDALNLNFLGEILMQLRKTKEATDIFNELIKFDKFNENALFNLSKIYLDRGKIDESIKYLKKLCDLYPNNYSYLYQLLRVENKKLNKDKVKEIKKKILHPKEELTNLSYANLILAKCYEDENVNLEFDYLIKGHNFFFKKKLIASRQELDFYTKQIPEFMKKIREIDHVCQNDYKPIFITGLPRSGTTLIEKFIYNSKKVNLGDETQVFTHTLFDKEIFNNFNFKASDFNKLENHIVESYQQYDLCIDTNFFTDKSLENILYFELIKKIFPNAKFIYCKRDPLANVIGILKVNLQDLLWTHSLDNIYKIFSLYKNLEKEYQKNIYTIEIEKLSSNPKKILKDLYDYLNLNWNDSILDNKIDENLEIRTASNLQVRSKVYKHDPNKFTKYRSLIKSKGFEIENLYD